jgi:hypothetical protein
MNKTNFLFASIVYLFVSVISAVIFNAVASREFLDGLLISVITFFIYTSTSAISFFYKAKDFDFVLRVLLLITLQMLFFLSVALALIYTRDDLPLILFFLGEFLVLLVIQTFVLIRYRR